MERHQVRFCPKQNTGHQNVVNDQNGAHAMKQVGSVSVTEVSSEVVTLVNEKNNEEVVEQGIDKGWGNDKKVIEATADEDSVMTEDKETVFKIPVVKKKSEQKEKASKIKTKTEQSGFSK